MKVLCLLKNQTLKVEMVLFRGCVFYIGKSANLISMARTGNRVLLNRKTLHNYSFLSWKTLNICVFRVGIAVFLWKWDGAL